MLILRANKSSFSYFLLKLLNKKTVNKSSQKENLWNYLVIEQLINKLAVL